MGVVEGGIDSELPVILAADDLAPLETLQLDKSKILGFITQGGSGNSHTAILARTMGIPAICGLGDELEQGYEGRTAYIDGETGQVVLEPDELTLQTFQEKQAEQQRMKALMETMRGQEDVTLDGRHSKLYCNIGSPEDVSAVLANGGQGIGLFRSEFLYLAASDYPTEEEQFQAYKSVAEAMNGKRVIIRTLACDRQCNDLGRFFAPHHPAVLRALKMAADAAHEEGIWIGICGELGQTSPCCPPSWPWALTSSASLPPACCPSGRPSVRATPGPVRWNCWSSRPCD